MIGSAVQGLEERALNAWPAPQTLICSGWAVRAAGGYTKRANSANALAGAAPVETVVAPVEAAYARLGQPSIFRLSPLAPAGTDEFLEAIGYAALDPTLVLHRPTAAAPLPPDVQIDHVLTPTWAEGFAAANGVPPARRALHDRILAGIVPQTGFATLTQAGAPLAYALGVVERGAVGIFDVVVAPAARRRGYGLRITEALLAWGAAQGAREAYLQVVAANTPARALYAALRFAEAYPYHYRIKPAP
ncbi:N-acetyltransferase GCN5 [Elstera cyanobacteriorum]|uniref:GNAT family N-acetyltransferase n=1 Tax=Elstera cyanobacteriorum TaxID=2022747 RepID=UPI00198B3B90|nr:GNAT family N-acetyltransferase [Elstera cyanobacteriorum]GFZ96174.1 N-acetyltransferase GCN5 [Elstera cyanobacteriorum]